MDTTSVRYVNADAVEKFAEFYLRLGKLPAGCRLPRARAPRRLPHRVAADRVSRPPQSLPTNSSEIRDSQEVRQPSTRSCSFSGLGARLDSDRRSLGRLI